LLSATGPSRPEVVIEGLEILKALEGVTTHEHREVVPIVENTQDWTSALPDLSARLAAHPRAHAFLIRGHGLYTWAADVPAVRRHLEAFEYLFEIEARRRGGEPLGARVY
jgi:methylthioribulose-1-phosphate dehydratase